MYRCEYGGTATFLVRGVSVRTRLLAFGLSLISVALAACGGGGGGGGGPTPATAPPSTPTPSPTPFANGDSMTFTGSRTTAATFAYPSPTPYPPTNTTDAITQNVTVNATPNPFGSLSAGDFHTVETDAGALVTRATTTDAWLGMSGVNLVEYGYKSVDDSGNSLSAQFTTPLITDELPETGGATWTNSAAAVLTEKDADGTNTTRTYAADGTYSESLSNLSIGLTATTTEIADGSGSINANGNYLGGAVNTIVFSTPAPGTGQITVTVNYVQPPTPSPAPSGQPSPSPAPTIAPRIYTAPPWYGSTTPSLYSQNTTVTTTVAFPASCNVPSSYGTSGNKLVQTTTRLDTVLGYTDTQTQTTYTNAQVGPVCVVVSDVQKDYYDYQDDFAAANGQHFHFPGTALSTTTISETLTLQTGAVVHDIGRRTQSQSQQANVSAARVAAAMASVTLRAERARHQRELKLVRFVSSPNKEVR